MSDPIYIQMKHIDVKELGILIPIKSYTYYVYDKHEYYVLDISPRIKAYYNLYV